MLTNGSDDPRSGWYPNQPGLSPGLVGSSNFGQQFAAPVDGQVYAQPLVDDETLLVATEKNQVYGLNPTTASLIWHHGYGVSGDTTFGAPFNPADVGCADLTPWIGITGTPVVDQATHTMYFLSKSYVAGTTGTPIWRMYALDTRTGAARPNFPVTIQGAGRQRPLSHLQPQAADAAPRAAADERGRLRGLRRSLHRAALQRLGRRHRRDDRCEEGDVEHPGRHRQPAGGIWQSGSGLVSDGPGQILFATGNGSTPTGPVPGSTPPEQLGLSVVRLTVQSDGTLKPTDFFAPYDAATLDAGDMDLGSGGPLALPAQFGTTTHPHLLVQAGKQGYVYLLDRDNLGGKGQGTAGGDAVVGRFGPDGGVWGKPTAWPGMAAGCI